MRAERSGRMIGMFGLLVYDLRRLLPYLSIAVVAAVISVLRVGAVGIVFPMIGAAWAVYGLSTSDRQSGWAALAVSSGMSRRDFVRAKLSALLVFSVPLAIVPVACSLAMDPGHFDIAVAGLGTGTYLAGIGWASMVTLSRPKDDVSLLRCIAGQFAYLVVAVIALIVTDAVTGGDLVVGTVVCLAIGLAMLVLTYARAVERFGMADL